MLDPPIVPPNGQVVSTAAQLLCQGGICQQFDTAVSERLCPFGQYDFDPINDIDSFSTNRRRHHRTGMRKCFENFYPRSRTEPNRSDGRRCLSIDVGQIIHKSAEYDIGFAGELLNGLAGSPDDLKLPHPAPL